MLENIKNYLSGLSAVQNFFFAGELSEIKGLPIIYHQITLRCDGRCKTCKIWQLNTDRSKELTTDEVKYLLDKGKEIGAKYYGIWGGEPFLREDLAEIMEYAKKLKYIVNICTNGSFLEKNAEKVCKYVDWLMVSIDYPGEFHDQIRGNSGLYEKAINGLKEARKWQDVYHFSQLKIWTTVSKLNIDKVEDLAKLAKNLGVSIQFFPMSIIGRYNENYALTVEEKRKAFQKIKSFKKQGYPIINTNYHLDILSGDREFRCNYPKISIFVDSEGSIYSCENPFPSGEKIKTWGNIKNNGFKEIIESEEFKDFGKKMEKCNRCAFPEMIDLSKRVDQSDFHRRFIKPIQEGLKDKSGLNK